MSITKIILLILLIITFNYFLNLARMQNMKKKRKKKRKNRKLEEEYLERDNFTKMPSIFLLSNNKSYKKRVKDLFKLTENDYKDLLNVPSDNKIKINLKKDWKYILKNEIDSMNNDISIKLISPDKNIIESDLKYNLNLNIKNIYEFGIKEFQTSLDVLVNNEKNIYILDNTDFDNLFEDKDFDYYKGYEKNSDRYNIDGTLIKLTDKSFNENTGLINSYNDELYTYESQCNLDKTIGGIIFKKEKLNEDNLLLDIYNNIPEYNNKYVMTKVNKPSEKNFKNIEYDDITENLVNNFKKIEKLILNNLNTNKDLFLLADTFKKIKNLNITNNFKIVDRKINYILKNTKKSNEYFYNGEIVIYRERNHGIHIRVNALKEKRRYYITNIKVLGIIFNDKIEKMDTINESIMNPLYYKFKDKHVITKNELEKELADIIDRSSIENFTYLFSKFKKIRKDRGIMVNDFELIIYTSKILLDIKNSKNFKKINKINNPSFYTRIFGS